MKTEPKVCFISSKGGHLIELKQLNDLDGKYDCFWITFRGKDTDYYLKNKKIYLAYFPESRNLVNLIRNSLLAVRIFLREKPTHLVSAGAGIAVPFFIIGKLLFGTKTIYIESFDFINYPSLTGKILYKFVDLFLVQHSIQKKWYKKANYWGSLL